MKRKVAGKKQCIGLGMTGSTADEPIFVSGQENMALLNGKHRKSTGLRRAADRWISGDDARFICDAGGTFRVSLPYIYKNMPARPGMFQNFWVGIFFVSKQKGSDAMSFG